MTGRAGVPVCSAAMRESHRPGGFRDRLLHASQLWLEAETEASLLLLPRVPTVVPLRDLCPHLLFW